MQNTRPTNTLRVHPSLSALPQWADDDPRFYALCDDVAASGVIEPIKITETGEIVDGRHRWRAAKRMTLPTVPVVVVAADQVVSMAISTLLARRHFTRGQLAYVAYPLFAPACAEAKRRRIDNLKNGNVSRSPTECEIDPPKTADSLAERLGVCRNIFDQAAKLHRKFEKNEALRQEWEPKIMSDDPPGLGAVLAGIAGQETTPKSHGSPDERAQKTVLKIGALLMAPAGAWLQMDGPSRTLVRQELLTRWSAVSPSELKEIGHLLDELHRLALSLPRIMAADPGGEGLTAAIQQLAAAI